MTVTLLISLGGVVGAVGMIGYGLHRAVQQIAPVKKPSQPRRDG
jgi:hypothetical protein